VCIGAGRFSRVTSRLLEWQSDYHFHSAGGDAPELQFGPIAVQNPQTRAQICDADALGACLPIGWQLRAIIADTQTKVPVVTRPGDADGASSDTLGNAMLDGILDQGLKQEAWNLHRQQFGRNVYTDLQALSEANLLNVDIPL
jgi:hypothetical protein